ncbi:rhodanese-like domain-containing protein 4, chloroplastic [Rutidosis leptorrhynchoides]|uniref:rhodanese-like domain-containing protein 4, chloroplastic n=1 Tax=Rutidosis leptorrhynchoides TaxID=125765 RepID=UPI003A9A0814
MEAMNAAVILKPISVLKPEPTKKHSTLSPTTFPQLKISKPKFNGTSLVLLSSSFFNYAYSKALTYEEALNQSTTSDSSSFSTPDIDVSGVIDGIINFSVENPVVVAGGAALLAVPFILSQVFGKSSKPWGVESAKIAYEKLGDDINAQLLDIRPSSEIRLMGSPDIKGFKKKSIAVAYNGDDKQGFLKKLALKFKDPENTTLFVLDKFDGSSELVAELVTVNGFKAAYAIKDGADGSRGWMNSGLPWVLPKKSLAFDFSSLTDAIDGLFGDSSDAVSVIFSVAAATGLGLLAFTEVETILEVLGSAAIVQLVTKKLLFAEDRKKTIQEFNEFVATNIGPKELLEEIKDIGKALLPPVTSKTLPAPTTTTEEAVVEPTNSAPPEIQAEPATPPPEIQAAAPSPVEPPVQVNAVPKTEVKEEAVPKPTRSLSPYPYYPNLKPPTSPTPSRP